MRLSAGNVHTEVEGVALQLDVHRLPRLGTLDADASRDFAIVLDERVRGVQRVAIGGVLQHAGSAHAQCVHAERARAARRMIDSRRA